MTNYERENYTRIYAPMKATTPETIAPLESMKFFGNLYKITEQKTNWNIYTDRTHKTFFAIAKTGTHCRSSYYGKINHVRAMIHAGHIQKSSLTKLGYRILFS